MADFDPDAYLKQAAPAGAAPAFDPDAYLGRKSAPAAVSEVPGPSRTYAAIEVPAAAVSNIPASAKRFATGIYEAVTNPIQTLSGLLDIGAGALQKAVPQSVADLVNKFDANPAAAQRAVAAAEAAGGMYKERYGSLEGIKRTLAEDPVGAAADISTLLSGGSALTARAAPGVSKALGQAATATNPLTPVVKTAQLAIDQKRKILPSALAAEEQANAVRDATLRAAQAEGFVVPPGSVTPSAKNILAERLAGKTNLEQLMSVQNQAVTDRLSRRALALPENAPLTPETMKKIRDVEYSKGYEPINRIGKITTDNAYLDDLVNIEGKYAGAAGSFPGAVPEQVEKLIKNYTVGAFTSDDALKASRVLREDAKASFRRGESALGQAQIAVSNALENQIERSLIAAGSPKAAEMLEQFRLSRQRMAIAHTVEDAIKEGTGSVMASKLARDLQNGKYVSGDIRTIAEFSNAFPRASQTPSQIGTPASATLAGQPMRAAIGGGLGFLVGGAPGAGAGAAIAGVAPEVTSALMRQYLMSQSAQRGAIPSYRSATERFLSPEMARNALLAQEARELDLAARNQNALAR